MDIKYDDGYGINGNLSHYIVLNEILKGEANNIFRDYLKKENPKKYNEFLDYEKRMGEH